KGVFEKWEEEIAELQDAMGAADRPAIEQEIGDLLFHSVNIARKLHVEAEVALNEATDRFRDRVRMLEALAIERGLAPLASQSADDLERLWQEAKKRLASSPACAAGGE
ncbi:MAG: MazG nucleotide pyrophosphohydrolase domain-containing protein, partial [Verrucomicrobiia bacterium]